MRFTGLRCVAAVLICLCFAASAQAYEYYFPHLTGGQTNWKDILEVDNNSGVPGTYTITLYNQGTQVYTGMKSIGAHAYANVELKKLNGAASGATCGKITTAFPDLVFRLAFESTSTGGVAEFLLSDDTEDALCFLFANYADSTSWKGLAAMNPGSSSASLTIYAIGSGGLLAQTTDSVAGNSRVAKLHDQWFPAIDVDDLERIVITSTQDLTGITISGDSSNSKLLFTPATELDAYTPPGNGGATPSLLGTWSGTWESGEEDADGTVTLKVLVHAGSTISGTIDLTGTDCGSGEIDNIPFTGTVSGNIVDIDGNYLCGVFLGELDFAQGVVSGNTMSGEYDQTVNGSPYDSGTWSVTKQ